MGWGSAGDIFDPVAQALVDLGASEDVKRRVLGPLIDKLRDEDWDTCDESAERFVDDPVIVALFAERGLGPGAEDEEEELTSIQEYALALVADGAEGTAEDDLNEDGDIAEDEHEAAVELAMAIIRGIRAYPRSVLALAIPKETETA